MAPGYLNFETTYPIDLNEDHHPPLIFSEDHNQCQQYTHLNFPMNNNPHHLQASSSSTTSSSTYPNNCPIYFFTPSQDQAGFSFAGSQFQPYPFKQEVDDNYGSIGSSYDQTATPTSPATLEINKKDEHNGLKFSISKKHERSFPVHEVDSTCRHHQTFNHEDHQISNAGGDGLSADHWMSSKMRIMKKMMKEETRCNEPLPAKAKNNCIDNNNSNNENSCTTATIRVCADCNTTKTPLWRSGPRGPKTLCNACGIRQRKARRAMAAAAAAANNSSAHHHMSTIRAASAAGNHKNSSSPAAGNNGLFGAQKKRSKLVNKPPPRTTHIPPPHSSSITNNNSNSTITCSTTDDDNNGRKTPNCFEEFASSLSKKLSLDQQVLFPEEEKDAAILLMAISCGLVHG